MGAWSFSVINRAAFILLKKPIKYSWNLGKFAQGVASPPHIKNPSRYSKHPGLWPCQHPVWYLSSYRVSPLTVLPNLATACVNAESVEDPLSKFYQGSFMKYILQNSKEKLALWLSSTSRQYIQQIFVQRLFSHDTKRHTVLTLKEPPNITQPINRRIANKQFKIQLL